MSADMEPGKTYTLRTATASLTYACTAADGDTYTGTLTGATIEDVTISGDPARNAYIECGELVSVDRFVLSCEEAAPATTVPAAKMRAVAAGFARQAFGGSARAVCGDCAWVLNGVLDELGATSETEARDWQAFADLRTQVARLHGLDSSASLESIVDELTKLPTP